MADVTFSHIALACKDPRTMERFYAKHFGFRRTRVYPAESIPGLGEVIIITSGGLSLELFPAREERPVPPAGGDGPWHPGFRHLAFLVDDLDAKLVGMGDEARLTLPGLAFT